MTMSSSASDWAKRGSEAAVATVSLDGKLHQHVILFAGSKDYEYRVSLGSLLPGEHEITIERDDRHWVYCVPDGARIPGGTPTGACTLLRRN